MWRGTRPSGAAGWRFVFSEARKGFPIASRLLIIAFAGGVTLHNLEEALFLPRWARANVTLPVVALAFRPSSTIYWILSSAVSAVVWLAVLGVTLRPTIAAFHFALSGFALAMAVNAFLPHLAMSIAKTSYCPGTATAILLNLPLGVLVVREQLVETAVPLSDFWRQTLFYAILLGVFAFGSLFGFHKLFSERDG